MKIILTAAVFVVVALTSEPARTGPTHTSDQVEAVAPRSGRVSAAATFRRTYAGGRPALKETRGAAETDGASAPTITCPSNVTLECHQPHSPSHAGTAAATGRGPIRIDFEDTTRPGRCANENVIARMWIATDADGQTSTCVQRIWVVDSTPPEISFVSERTPDHDDALAVDNCDPSPSFGFIDNTTPNSAPGTSGTTRIWTAVDACGNVNVQTKAVTFRGLADADRAAARPGNLCAAEPMDGIARTVGGERPD